jgi:hypothetical protein|tara:strand:- start:223 stop:474 length:252 start_codon:yes stop_codon:yes gene_type:complete
MSKDNIKEPLTIQEHGFFTSMKSLEDVMDYMTKYGGKENAYLCAMTQAFTINTIVRIMDEECDGTATCKRSANPILNLREAKS